MTAIIKSLDHAFASVFQDIETGAKAVFMWEQKDVQPNATQIELLSALVPGYGPEIVIMERLAFAALGAVANIVNQTKNPTTAAAQNPGIAVEIFQDVVQFLAANPTLVTQAVQIIESPSSAARTTPAPA
jgi:hypothetical protein